MRHISLIYILAGALAAQKANTASPAGYAIHESRDTDGPAWQRTSRVNESLPIVVRIGLTQKNLDLAESYLMNVSHPDSVHYGKYWTAQQVRDTFAPSNETVSQVLSWLGQNSINASRVIQTEDKGWLAFVASAHELESLVHANYFLYSHGKTSETVLATDKYHVPASLQQHIDYVHPGVRLATSLKTTRAFKASSQTPRWHSNDDLSNCDQAVTPDCIKALYNIPSEPSQLSNTSNPLGIFEEGYYDVREDLNLFFQNFSLGIPNNTYPNIAHIDQPSPDPETTDYALEYDLDLEVAYPIIYPQNITLFTTDDSNYVANASATTGLFNTFLDAIDGSYCTYCAYGECGNDPEIDPIYPDPTGGGYEGQLQCGTYEPTNVISMSYGLQEYDFPVAYQQRQCNEWLKLGLQGTSVFVASGDDGVGAYSGDDNANGCLGYNGTIFSPAFPNTCPWITNVGATMILPGHTAEETESVAYESKNGFASGGGFSNVYAIPDYQADAVAEYFDNYPPSYPYYVGDAGLGATGITNTTKITGVYNRTGRGYPDIAANGAYLSVWTGGAYHLGSGTSGSTPIFAAIVNRIVEARLAAGKGPLGFINPALYANSSIFNDVTNGTNPGCDTQGFSAVPGWDPATGLGTPNFPKMLEYFLSLS